MAGFVVDAANEGTLYPSAGDNSADVKVQAVYWRCLVALFASARITNPEQRLALFCNVAPPVIDGIAIGEVLERYGEELHLAPLTKRLPQRRTAAWGNVLYFFDVLNALEGEPDDLRSALLDSAVDEPINGMLSRTMDQAACGLSCRECDPLPHFCGERFATTVVSQGAHVCASSHDIRDPHVQLVQRPVRIGAQCWIAAEAFVAPGVIMHDGAVLAARGALFKNAEVDTVYRGNPATVLRPGGLKQN